MVSDLFFSNFGVDLDHQYRNRVGTTARKSKELPYGATMPLGEFQEDLRVGEGLPLGRVERRQTNERGVP